MQSALRIVRLTDAGDSRGSSFTAPEAALQFLDALRDMHVADILPGAIRGNHFHQQRREVLCIRYAADWSLHWDAGPDTQPQSALFTGSGAVLVEIPPNVSHAVRNDGNEPLYVVGLSDIPYDPAQPDSYARRVV